MKTNLQKLTAIVMAAALIFMTGCAKPAASDTAGAKQSSIVGFWVAETDTYEIRYHFHEDGHYHGHVELHTDGSHAHDHAESEEADTFTDGTYAVSGNAVTITVEERITDCESEELKKQLDNITEVKFTYEFAKDGESWVASVEGLGDVKFVKDDETEDWAEDHIKHSN